MLRIRPRDDTEFDRSGQTRALQAAAEVAEAWTRRAAEHDRTGAFPERDIAEAWAAGLGCLTVPIPDGGVGADLTTTVEVVRRLGAGDASAALILAMHLLVVKAATIDGNEWPEPPRRRLIESSLAGPALANHLRVEPELGTPARGGVPATRAVRVAEGWRLSGRKIYSTGSHGLRWMIVWAATEPDRAGRQLAGSFAVPGDAPGVSIHDTWDHLGMRASASHDVILDDVQIPADHALTLHPVTDRPPAIEPVLGAWLAMVTTAVYLGVADAAQIWLRRWLGERTPANLGASLSTLPRFQAAVGEIEAGLLAADAAVDAVASGVDAGGEAALRAGRRAALAKVIATRAAISSVEEAVKLTGNPGLSRANPLERHLRDVVCSRVHTPQEDAVLVAAGRAALDARARS